MLDGESCVSLLSSSSSSPFVTLEYKVHPSVRRRIRIVYTRGEKRRGNSGDVRNFKGLKIFRKKERVDDYTRIIHLLIFSLDHESEDLHSERDEVRRDKWWG